ncbi:MAG: type I-C CRISPR-associated protein Cas8c/Csd1, partial [Rhodospirillales bacterium]|nr:type I-C CRISPR-associated protein Cas8c/Csd1 [Rhodospirillales bacterium]
HLFDLLARIKAGRVPVELAADQDVTFYVLGLSPNAARLSVRLWQTDTLGTLLNRVGQHQRDLDLVIDHPKRPPCPSLRALANALRPKDGEGKARGRESLAALNKLLADLTRAVFGGGLYPATLLPLLLARFRNDRWITHPRVALLKALLNRSWRLGDLSRDVKRKELSMALDETRTEIGYRLGRLFAALELLQEKAHGDTLNATIRDKFIAGASTTPRTVFPYLLRLSQTHRKKARRDNRFAEKWLSSQVETIMAEVSDIPATLTSEHQALFFAGYYQQRQGFFTKREAKPAADSAE